MSTLPLEDHLGRAIPLRENGDLEEARGLLVELANEHPENAVVNLQCAWVHDKLGLEKEAVPFAYRRAIEAYAADLDRSWT